MKSSASEPNLIGTRRKKIRASLYVIHVTPKRGEALIALAKARLINLSESASRVAPTKWPSEVRSCVGHNSFYRFGIRSFLATK